MKSKHHTLNVELFERWGSTYERSWMQPGPVARFVRITIGTKPAQD